MSPDSPENGSESHLDIVRQLLGECPAGSVVSIGRREQRVVGCLVSVQETVAEVLTKGGLRQYVPLSQITSINGFRLE